MNLQRKVIYMKRSEQSKRSLPKTIWMDSELMRKEVPGVALNPVTVDVIDVTIDGVYFCPEGLDKQMRMPKSEFLRYFNYKGCTEKA